MFIWGFCFELKKTNNIEDDLMNKKWIPHKSIPISAFPHGLQFIKGQLWICHGDGLTTLSQDLQLLSSISCKDTGGVRDFIQIENEEIVVATQYGLFQIDSSGKLSKESNTIIIKQIFLSKLIL